MNEPVFVICSLFSDGCVAREAIVSPKAILSDRGWRFLSTMDDGAFAAVTALSEDEAPQHF